jgi:hypothetical protein
MAWHGEVQLPRAGDETRRDGRRAGPCLPPPASVPVPRHPGVRPSVGCLAVGSGSTRCRKVSPPYGSWWEWRGVDSLRSVPRPEWDPLAGAGWSWDPAEGEGIRGWSVGLGLGLDPAIEEDPSSSVLLLPRDQRVGGPWASTPLLSGCPSETFHGVFWIHRPAVLRGCRCFPLRSLLFPAAAAQVALRA